MSGGSYGYLCYVDNIEDLTKKLNYLEDMSRRLRELSYAQKASKETDAILFLIEEINKKLQNDKLKEVWRAIEWWDSSDSGEAEVKDAILKYLNE